MAEPGNSVEDGEIQVGPAKKRCSRRHKIICGVSCCLFLVAVVVAIVLVVLLNRGIQAPPCNQRPCQCGLLGTIGVTTLASPSTDTEHGNSLPVAEDIFGAFEAGFTSAQDSILAGLGCNPGSLGHVAGGIDTMTAEAMVAHQCKVKLPREEGGEYISLLDRCGGHTREYHLHERLSCLYKLTGGHSTKVGKESNSGISDADAKFLYGKWEDFENNILPELDACGGHFGVTPDSDGKVVYHYHVQDSAPFTFGCYGPDFDSDGNEIPVTVKRCRELYNLDNGCGGSDILDVTTDAGTLKYDHWCPCYDAAGSNVGTKPLPIESSFKPTTNV